MKPNNTMSQRAVDLREKIYPNLAFVLHENGGLTRENMSAANCALQNIVDRPDVLTESNIEKFEKEGSRRALIMGGVLAAAYQLKLEEPEFFRQEVS